MSVPDQESDAARHQIIDPPPFLGTWKRVYAAIVIYLATLILLFYLFERDYIR